MNRLEKLRSQYAEIIEKMRSLLNKADEEKRDLTEEETRSYEQFEADSEKIKAQVAREERLSVAELEMRRRIDDPLRPPVTNAPPDKKEFKSLGEFLYAVRFTPTDPRLMELREQQMVVGESGGFAVPPAFIPTLLQVTPQDAIWRPRCTVIPAGDSPDTDLTMPALDQGTGSNMYGGVAVYATSEGATLTETDAKIREVKLQPHETGAFVTVTDKLLRNWSACSALIQTLLRRALIAWEDTRSEDRNKRADGHHQFALQDRLYPRNGLPDRLYGHHRDVCAPEVRGLADLGCIPDHASPDPRPAGCEHAVHLPAGCKGKRSRAAPGHAAAAGGQGTGSRL